jgi:hypothetical protein
MPDVQKTQSLKSLMRMLNCIARFLAMPNICSDEGLVSVSIQFISHIDIALNAVFSFPKKVALPHTMLSP